LRFINRHSYHSFGLSSSDIRQISRLFRAERRAFDRLFLAAKAIIVVQARQSRRSRAAVQTFE
jgi:hypothetical protein